MMDMDKSNSNASRNSQVSVTAAHDLTGHQQLQATEGRFEHGPLDVGEVHAVEYDGDPTDVSVDAARLSGQLFSEVRAAERPCAKYQQ